jgi:TetR/AcrR family tetracycline transcriptional repressor
MSAVKTVPIRIVDAALKLLNQEGLDGLSTRRLAKALNIQGPSLYHHFHSKAELMGHMADRMMGNTFKRLDYDVAWDVWLHDMAHASRKMVLKYRDGARVLATSYPTDSMQHKLVPGTFQPLLRAGFSVESARAGTVFLAMFVIGWTINEQNDRMRKFMAEQFDIDKAFAAGVESFVAGIATSNGIPRSVA